MCQILAVLVQILGLKLVAQDTFSYASGLHLADHIFRSIIMNEKFYTLIMISLKYVP